MRTLLDSSWTKFGPAMRDSLDWPGPSALPSTDRQLAGQQSAGEGLSTRSASTITVGCLSLLLLLGLLFFLLWRKRRGLEEGKLGLAGVIALEDLQDPERNCELLSSLRRSQSQRRSQRRGGSPLPSSSSEQDVSDGVFLMVYLPPPYEQTLTRIARAASIKSSRGDISYSPSLDMSPSPGLDLPPSPGLGPPSSHAVDPPSSPHLDPPPSRIPDPAPSPHLDPPPSHIPDPAPSPHLDPPPTRNIDPSLNSSQDVPSSSSVNPRSCSSLDPPSSPNVDPPPSPGPLMSFSPGPETGNLHLDEVRDEKELEG